MLIAPPPEMLWESVDPENELRRRFGFEDAAAAVDWAADLLAGDYRISVRSVDRLVISAQNLMVWVTTPPSRLMIKICRIAAVHGWLDARAAMVDWLADHDHPVARPLTSLGGERQLLRDDRSIGVQPVLDGSLLDAGDDVQVRAAGQTLAALHDDLACWPDAKRLTDAWPVAGRGELWVLPEGRAETAPELVERLRRRIDELPDRSGLPAEQPVHTDFRGANLLWHDTRISGVLDFEEARLDPAVVDLAHAVCLLGTWYHDWQPITPQRQRLLIDSYTDRRPLSETEDRWLQALIGWGMLGLGWYAEADRWL
ncbi:phosphotransferase enzyme family protein [Microlunatus soli]|uniref:Homoserine kinase type II n=1 Tax=Microlunatus soli TaxID=630515 RepID=A0A1H1R6F4_9ACTN|nr:phosphotransferase [Microlunatus soli]SDS31312.1 homoserine kinase type II [Microlunatus soli]